MADPVRSLHPCFCLPSSRGGPPRGSHPLLAPQPNRRALSPSSPAAACVDFSSRCCAGASAAPPVSGGCGKGGGGGGSGGGGSGSGAGGRGGGAAAGCAVYASTCCAGACASTPGGGGGGGSGDSRGSLRPVTLVPSLEAEERAQADGFTPFLFLISGGGVNGSSTFRGTLTNRISSVVTGLNGSLSCGRVTSARSFSSNADLQARHEIGMPSLSPTVAEGNIAKWVRKEGDKVSPGEVLCEVETDKVTVEMECIQDGYLAKIVQGDGAKVVKVGEIICLTVEEEGGIEKFKDYKSSSSDAPAAPSESKAKSEPAEPKAEEKVPAKAPEPKAPKTEEASRPAHRIFFSSLARKLGEDNNVPLSSVKGTGPDELIPKADIEEYLASLAKGGKSETFAASGLDYTDIPNAQMTKVTANHLLASKQTIPHNYLTVDTRIDNLIKLPRELNPLPVASGGKKISLNDFVIKAAALALQKVPQCNSSWINDLIRQCNDVNIHVAVQTEHGLFVPVVRDADKKGLGTIGAEVKQLAQRASDNSLKPKDYEVCIG
uniref:Uncharacterized protein n=1 Tax=Avena sativa TaxID=4498 RepID=A0ACD5ZJH2_AVESA